MTALLVVDMPWAGELLEPLIAELGSCAAAALVHHDEVAPKTNPCQQRQPQVSQVQMQLLPVAFAL